MENQVRVIFACRAEWELFFPPGGSALQDAARWPGRNESSVLLARQQQQQQQEQWEKGKQQQQQHSSTTTVKVFLNHPMIPRPTAASGASNA